MEKIVFILIAFCLSANAADREMAEKLNSAGVELAEGGQLSQAYEKFRAATEADATFPKAQSNAAEAAMELGRKGEALEHFGQLHNISEGKEREEALDKLMKVSGEMLPPPALPSEAEKALSNGQKALQEKKAYLAAAEFEKSVKQAPWSLDSRYLLAQAYAFTGSAERARAQMEIVAKYSKEKAKVAEQRKLVEEIIAQKGAVRQAHQQAAEKKEELESALNHSGLAIGIGFPSIGGIAHEDGSTKIEYGDIFNRATMLDVNYYYFDPDSWIGFRTGLSIFSLDTDNSREVPTLGASSSTFNVPSTKGNTIPLYLGILGGAPFLHAFIDLGFSINFNKAGETTFADGSNELDKVPFRTVTVYLATGMRGRVHLNDKIGLFLEWRLISHGLHKAEPEGGASADGDRPSVVGAKDIGFNTFMGGAYFRFR